MDPGMVPFIWLGIAVAFGIVEACSPALVCIWFCTGAAAAFVASLLTRSLLIQIIVFLCASVLGLVALRPFFKKRATIKEGARTDVDALVGRTVTITREVPSQGKGRALLADTSWLAEGVNGQAMPSGARARVVRVDGARLIVEPLATPQEPPRD